MLSTDRHAGYLRLGLTNMARCQWWTTPTREAHWGAAVIAGSFFARNNPLHPACDRQLHRQLDLFVAAHPAGFLPEFAPTEPIAYESVLTEALGETVDRLCWVGHNVIYGALCLNALKRVPEMASPALIAGLARLLTSFNRSIPGRSWIGCSTGEVSRFSIDEGAFPPLENPQQLSALVLQELGAFRSIFRAESHHDLIGHLLDFTASVNLLYELGYEELFSRSLGPVKRLVTVLRRSQDYEGQAELAISSPVDKWPLRLAVTMDDGPLSSTYWERDFSQYSWDGGHSFAFPFAYYEHVRRVSPPVPENAALNVRKILGASNRL